MVTMMTLPARPRLPLILQDPPEHLPHDLPFRPLHRVSVKRYASGAVDTVAVVAEVAAEATAVAAVAEVFAWKVYCSGCRSWGLGDGTWARAVALAHQHIEHGTWR